MRPLCAIRMVIVLKNRAAIYQRETAEMLHNISLYPGLTEEQLCRFFPEKEATAKTLLAHMLAYIGAGATLVRSFSDTFTV